MQMETYMKGNGLMIKHMDLVSIPILMVLNMKVIGRKINKKGAAKKNGLMGQAMKGNINKEKNLDMEFLNGQMGVLTKEISKIIILMERVLIHGGIKENMKEIGKIIKWMDMEFLHGLMEGDMLASIKMIKKMDMDCLNGLMEKNIEGNGKMGNKMEKENFILNRNMYGENALFKMEKELNG